MMGDSVALSDLLSFFQSHSPVSLAVGFAFMDARLSGWIDVSSGGAKQYPQH